MDSTAMPTAGNTLATLAEQINHHHRAATQAARSAILNAKVAGELLRAAKVECGHGAWSTWLAANFQGSRRTARAYMQISKGWAAIESKMAGSAVLTIDAALRVLSAPRKDDEAPRLAELESAITAGREQIAAMDDAFEAVPFDPDLTIRCVGADGRTAIIIPVGGKYAYVGVLNDEGGYIDEIARGIAVSAIPWCLANWNFSPAGEWQSCPIRDVDRELVKEARDAWHARWQNVGGAA